MKTAKFIKNLTGDFKGEVKLYKVDPPMVQYNWDDEIENTFDHVVVSAIVAFDHGGSETFIFGSDDEGNVLNWGELKGSARGIWDHDLALENAGYTVE